MTLFNDISDLEARRLRYLSDADSKREEIARLIGDLDSLEKKEQKQRKQVRELIKQQDQQQRREDRWSRPNRSELTRQSLKKSIGN